MRATLIAFVITTLLASIGEGQSTKENFDRACRLASTQPLQDFYEAATLMRLIVGTHEYQGTESNDSQPKLGPA